MADPILWRNKVILAALGTGTYGDDDAPTAAANAIQMTNVAFQPMEGQSVSRDLDRPYLGAQPEIQANIHAALTGEVEIAGSGAAGTAPAWGTLARMSAFAEVVTAATDVAYSPISEGFEYGTIYVQIGRNLHKLTGTRGLMGFRVQSGQVAKLLFRFMGLFQQVSSAALPTPTLTAWQKPVTVSKANTAFSIDALAAPMEGLEVPVPGGLEGRFLVNSEAIRITDHPYRGTLTIEAPDVADKNFFSLAEAGSEVALSIVHGTVAGNIVDIAAPAVQVGRPPYGQTQGILNHALPIGLIPHPGQPEVTITVK